MVNSVMTPAVVMRPISPEPASVNQRAPSGPAVMPAGVLPAPGTANSLVTTPAVVMRPIWSEPVWVNHRAPSGPAAMSFGALPAPGTTNSTIEAWMAASLPASGLMRPIRSPVFSVNQRLLSGPTVMFSGPRPAGSVNSVTTPVGRDAADATGVELGEPEVVVGPADDSRGRGVGRDACRE